MSSAEKARRWRQILSGLRDELPGEWALRGTGLGTLLVREPVQWALAWIGYTGSPSRPAGWALAGVQPLVLPFPELVLTHGVRMDEAASGPATVDLLSDTAAADVRGFVLDTGLPKIDDWPPDRLAEVAERDFAQRPPKRYTFWHELPGWRVVTDAGSPTDPATQLAELWRERARTASAKAAAPLTAHAEFYDRLRQAWDGGGRGAALEFLTGQRDEGLAARKLDRVEAA
ncbi:hypothetical protein [Micromonospora auratinigra]|uniref:Uncharacterized protein n=1 Tax=Micromonospora auratinigra TaxID=261654 RepID=A0A1A8ZGY5_9ACTN|nr:hypothetical protein [Micromonospora auratinigra]SBT43104.1 hypothetical protein GA0070611_2200 [Micromonospora auratinigra]